MLEIENNRVHFVIKCDPNRKASVLQKVSNKIKYKDLNIQLLNAVDVSTLLFYSDLVIGMFSNILIETALFHKCIVRYIPEGMPDLMEADIGDKVRDASQFRSALLSLINT